MRTYQKSSTGKTIIVRESEYNALGLPTANKTGVIRVKEGADLDAAVAHLESGEIGGTYEFSAVQNKDNGLYEMEFVAAVAVPAGALAEA